MSLVSGKQPNRQYPEEVMMTKEMLDQLPLESGTAIDHLQLFLSGDSAATVTNASDF